MRRAERLFRIIEKLRPGRLMTARDLAASLEVSERTIYRDIAHLVGLRRAGRGGGRGRLPDAGGL
jgi:predicted DNA-binding transcriptional regulator YafY